MTCRTVGSKGGLLSMGCVHVEGWLLVERERGCGGKHIPVCVHCASSQIHAISSGHASLTSHALNTCEVVDGVDGWHGQSTAAEFELGKLVSKTHSVRGCLITQIRQRYILTINAA